MPWTDSFTLLFPKNPTASADVISAVSNISFLILSIISAVVLLSRSEEFLAKVATSTTLAIIKAFIPSRS